MTKELVVQSDILVPNCAIVERVLSVRLDGLEGKLKDYETDLANIIRQVDNHVGDIWKTLRRGQDEIKEQLSAHAKDDTDALHEIQTQLLMRVPAWALIIMATGASVIGAMSMYILDHLK